MKPFLLALSALLLLASCASPDPEISLSNKASTEIPSEESSLSEEIPSEETSLIEETSSEESSVEEESLSSPTSEESSVESESEIMTPYPDSEYVPTDATFTPSSFPEKENNTYPEGKTIGEDPYVFALEYVMKGNQEDTNGTPTDCFQMRAGSKGGSAITSTSKLTGILSLTYLIKKTSYGDFTGSLTAYVGDSLDTMVPLDPAGEVSLKGQRELTFTCEFEDKYVSLRNESSYAVNGTYMAFHATNVTNLGWAGID